MDIKNSQTLTKFKDRIKSWSVENCLYRLYKTYHKNIGYIDTANTYSVTKSNYYFKIYFNCTFL